MGLNQRLKNMKKQNSKFKVEVVKSNNDRPYVVIETETNTIISRHVSRDGAQNVMNFQTKPPTFGNQPIPSFMKEPR